MPRFENVFELAKEDEQHGDEINDDDNHKEKNEQDSHSFQLLNVLQNSRQLELLLQSLIHLVDKNCLQ